MILPSLGEAHLRHTFASLYVAGFLVEAGGNRNHDPCSTLNHPLEPVNTRSYPLVDARGQKRPCEKSGGCAILEDGLLFVWR